MAAEGGRGANGMGKASSGAVCHWGDPHSPSPTQRPHRRSLPLLLAEGRRPTRTRRRLRASPCLPASGGGQELVNRRLLRAANPVPPSPFLPQNIAMIQQTTQRQPDAQSSPSALPAGRSPGKRRETAVERQAETLCCTIFSPPPGRSAAPRGSRPSPRTAIRRAHRSRDTHTRSPRRGRLPPARCVAGALSWEIGRRTAGERGRRDETHACTHARTHAHSSRGALAGRPFSQRRIAVKARS